MTNDKLDEGILAHREASSCLTFTPIGFIRSETRSKFAASHQPERGMAQDATVELLPRMNLEKALDDLIGFEHIWLISWLHRNQGWRPKVRPPRGGEVKRGVFATRSPYRPNPLGLTLSRLMGIDGLRLALSGCDLVDGTPILDIKPYIPTIDSIPDSAIGWLNEVERDYSLPPPYEVHLSDLAARQVAWLQERGICLLERALTLLRRDPTPHRTRRIVVYDRNLFRLGCADWRIFFTLKEQRVVIRYLRPGYAANRLATMGEEANESHRVQIAFLDKWP